jgi:RNA polymerase sigma-70 factor (ECF subfamily)
VTCRKIFSRARAHVLSARPRFNVDRERHRELLRRFAEAARSGDTAELAAVLADDVVLHGDGGGKARAIKKPVIGSAAVAQFVAAVTRTVPPGTSFQEIELNGAPALLAKSGGRAVAAILIDTDGERIRSVFAIANPDKLDALASVHQAS